MNVVESHRRRIKAVAAVGSRAVLLALQNQRQFADVREVDLRFARRIQFNSDGSPDTRLLAGKSWNVISRRNVIAIVPAAVQTQPETRRYTTA